MENRIVKVQSAIGYKFSSLKLFELALTHKSYSNEKSKNIASKYSNNEKLEFLGDAVLDLAMSEMLMEYYPDDNEGQLSRKRASLVNAESLSDVARYIGIHEILLLGRGEKATGGNLKPRLLACAVEALIGAVFLDANYEVVKKVVYRLFDRKVKSLKPYLDFEKDFKTRLQEYSQSRFGLAPIYEITGELGPAHSREFFADSYVAGRWLARGKGKSKKMAEQDAAKRALEVLL